MGKGVFTDLKNGTIKPYGIINFLTIDEGCDFILSSVNDYGIKEPEPWNISAEALVRLIDFIKGK